MKFERPKGAGGYEVKSMLAIMAVAVPNYIVLALSWFGVFTFVNAYVVRGIGALDADWAMVSLWFGGGNVFWQLVCSELSMRIGRRRTITLALFTVGIGYGTIGYIENLFVLGAVLACMSFGVAVMVAAWLPMLAEAGGNKPGRAIGVAFLTGNLVSAFTISLAGRIIGSMSYRHGFMVFGGICLVCAVVFYVLTDRLSLFSGQSKVLSLWRVPGKDLVRLMKGPFVFLMLFGYFMEPFGFHTANQLFPNLAMGAFNMTDAGIGTIVGFGRIPALLSLFVMLRIVDRINSLRAYGFAVGLMGISVVAMGFASTSLGLILAYLVYYLTYGGIWGTGNPSVNACVESGLRDSAFAIAGVTIVFGTFVAGLAHKTLLRGGVTLSNTFVVCGITASVAGLALFAYSFSGHGRGFVAGREPVGRTGAPCTRRDQDGYQ